MFWIIENVKQLTQFYNRKYEEVFIEPIYYHDNIHPKLNSVTALYIHPINGRKGYIINIDHTEATPIPTKHIISVLNAYKRIYIRDEKSFLYHFPLKTLTDISFNFINTTSYNNISNINTNAHEYFYKNYLEKHDVNRLIPIVKHYEKSENIYKQLKNYCYETNNFNTKISKVFYAVENNGIFINNDKFNKYFDISNPTFNTYNGRIYTRYNLHTTTGRPSNTYNGINFAALNKDNKCRSSFVPNNSYFLELDISAYHPTLLAQILSYPTNPEQIYAEFAKVAQVDIKSAKELMFRQLYGGIMDEYKHWDFFKRTQEYVNDLWEHWKTQGYISCPISDHRFYLKDIDNPNPHKLLNYVLQNTETYNNVNIIWDILKLLKNKNTKLVLYTYDAFLFDVDDTEESTIEAIKQIFDKYKLMIKTKTGHNYDFQ